MEVLLLMFSLTVSVKAVMTAANHREQLLRYCAARLRELWPEELVGNIRKAGRVMKAENRENWSTGVKKFMKEEQYHLAEFVLRHKTFKEPDNIDAWKLFAEYCFTRGDYKELQRCNSNIRRLDPGAILLRMESPEERERKRAEEEAARDEQERQAGLERHGRAEDLYRDAEDCEIAEYPPGEVLKAYKEVLVLNSNHAGARHKIGLIYYELGRYYSAKVELDEAKRLNPLLTEWGILRELKRIVKELDCLTPRGFVPKPSLADYGVAPQYLEGGTIIDDFLIDGYRAISVKFERRAGEEPVMFYRYKTLVYKQGEAVPSYLVGLESSIAGTCSIGLSDLRASGIEHFNYGLGHEDMAYEEFKYQVVAIMKDVRPPMMKSRPDEPDALDKEE